MEKNDVLLILECCLLAMDDCTKQEMVSLDISEQFAEAGINLYNYLSHKEFNVYNVSKV